MPPLGTVMPEASPFSRPHAAEEWFNLLQGAEGAAYFARLYGPNQNEAQCARYTRIIEGLLAADGTGGQSSGDIHLFSAPGRTELGGNHTDHNGGKVLAAAIQLDAVAAVFPRGDRKVFFRSQGFPDVVIDIGDTAVREGEKGTTAALLRGIADGFRRRGIRTGGWTANAENAVPAGSGLSSSAAVEVLAARIFDGLYGDAAHPLSPLELALIAQSAENDYYGKPSGLMDQTASAEGCVVAVDFSGQRPEVTQTALDLARFGYTLCVVNTGGSHAGLTAEYAAIPAEMRAVAAFLGAKTLGETSRTALRGVLGVREKAAALRERCGDLAVLRAFHFFDENDRVDAMLCALNNAGVSSVEDGGGSAFKQFLSLVNESGASSWQLLQNCYPANAAKEEGIPLALALSRDFVSSAKGGGSNMTAFRVHGGGFAGSIQAYIPNGLFPAYTTMMETVFGAASVTPLFLRAPLSIK